MATILEDVQLKPEVSIGCGHGNLFNARGGIAADDHDSPERRYSYKRTDIVQSSSVPHSDRVLVLGSLRTVNCNSSGYQKTALCWTFAKNGLTLPQCQLPLVCGYWWMNQLAPYGHARTHSHINKKQWRTQYWSERVRRAIHKPDKYFLTPAFPYFL